MKRKADACSGAGGERGESNAIGQARSAQTIRRTHKASELRPLWLATLAPQHSGSKRGEQEQHSRMQPVTGTCVGQHKHELRKQTRNVKDDEGSQQLDATGKHKLLELWL